MTGKSAKGYTPPSRAELQAMRDLKQQNVPSGEAGRREQKLLQHYAAAQEDLQWIVDNNAWTDLGFETFTGWYTTKIQPVVAAAGLRPTQAFALYVLAAVRADEALRPPAQRLLQRELAGLVGVSESTLRRLSQDRSQPSNGAGADLDEAPKSPLVEAMTQAIEEAQTAAADLPEVAADGGEGVATAPYDPSASGPSASPSVDGPDVTPEDPEGSAGESLPSERSAGHAAATAPASDPSADTPAAERSPTPHSALVAEQPGPNVHIESRFAPKGAPGCFSAGGDRPQERLSDVTCPVCRGWLAGDGADFVDRWRRGGALLEDSSPEASEASPRGEAPAGGTVNPNPEEGPAVAMPVEPGIDHPFVGEAPTPPSAAGVQPSPVAGVFTGGDEVEGEAGPSLSTDRPVVIVATVEDMIACTEYLEIPPAEWESWTPARRRAVIEEFGAETMNNAGGYGSGVESGAPDSDLDDEPIDPADALVELFEAPAVALVDREEFDAEVLGPLLTADQLARLQTAIDDLSHFVGALESWRNP